eukprot:scaffold20967_cov43-Prasinocladus_malaysianus.AAC.1
MFSSLQRFNRPLKLSVYYMLKSIVSVIKILARPANACCRLAKEDRLRVYMMHGMSDNGLGCFIGNR